MTDFVFTAGEGDDPDVTTDLLYYDDLQVPQFVLTNNRESAGAVRMVCRFVQSVERELTMLSRTTSVDTEIESEME